MGDRPVTAVWGIGDAHRRAAGRARHRAPSSELARADHDELARHFGPTIGPHLRILGLGGDDSPARRRAARRQVAQQGGDVHAPTSPTPTRSPRTSTGSPREVTAEVVADGPAGHPRGREGAHGDVLDPHKISKLPGGPTTDPDEVAAMAAVVLDRFGDAAARCACFAAVGGWSGHR